MDADERRSRATEEASFWWARLGTRQPEEISPADREQFTRWLRESPVHVAEWLHVAHVHDALGRFRLWGEVSTENAEAGQGTSDQSNVVQLGTASGPVREEHASRPGVVLRWGALAASVVVAIVAAWLTLTVRGDVISTQRTERRELMLSDGSVVRLEPESRLRVTFDRSERRVVLEKGRALFRVAKNPQRPFLVRADETTVRAVGTAFGVEHRAGGVVVTVTEGSVAVTRQAEHPSTQLLTAGQQVRVQPSGATDRARSVDTERALAWTEGRLVFENETLADVVAEFNRYNRTQLRIADPELAARRISGVFEATDTETLLAFIRAGSHVTFTRKGEDEISIAADP
jgi:transmembrane sensor